jgi:hypothetical protein
MEKALVSIIIPRYDLEAYLASVCRFRTRLPLHSKNKPADKKSVSSYVASALTGPLESGGNYFGPSFLVSGGLISSLCYKAQKKFGSVDIFRFWMRTVLAYSAVVLLLYERNTLPDCRNTFYQS